jgi:hypothetical protein
MVRAIGRLEPDGVWVGFADEAGGYRLVFGSPTGAVVADAATDPGERRAALVAAAIAFYLEALPDPPAELEATQADVARLVASLVTNATSAADAALGREALDAIDDGLPSDAVALRLQQLLPAGADPLEILRDRARSG